MAPCAEVVWNAQITTLSEFGRRARKSFLNLLPLLTIGFME